MSQVTVGGCYGQVFCKLDTTQCNKTLSIYSRRRRVGSWWISVSLLEEIKTKKILSCNWEVRHLLSGTVAQDT